MQDLERHAAEAVAMRRTLHRRPEEGWSEFETTCRIVTALEALGLPVHCGREVIDPAHVLGRDEKLVAAEARAREAGVPQAFLDRPGHYTGAVAELDTGRPGPVTALRFDIDCVLVEESGSPDHPPAARRLREHAAWLHARLRPRRPHLDGPCRRALVRRPQGRDEGQAQDSLPAG